MVWAPRKKKVFFFAGLRPNFAQIPRHIKVYIIIKYYIFNDPGSVEGAKRYIDLGVEKGPKGRFWRFPGPGSCIFDRSDPKLWRRSFLVIPDGFVTKSMKKN